MTEYNVDDVLDMDNYSINQLDEYFIKNKVEVIIYGGKSFVHGGNWAVKLEKQDDGINLKIETKANTLYVAMYDAYEKFNQVAKRGAPNLLAPVIEHKTLPSDTPLYEHQPLAKDNNNGDLDDDIPF